MREAATLEQTNFSPTLQQIMKPIERRGQAINLILAGLLLFVIAWGLWATWRDRHLPKIDSIAIEGVHVVGSTALCPGDSLTILYQVSIEGMGVVMWDDSVMRTNQPAQFSEPKRFIVEGPVTLDLRDVWRVPQYPDDTTSSLLAWLPGGGYTRYIAVSAPATFTSRFTPPALLKVGFSIRANCPA